MTCLSQHHCHSVLYLTTHTVTIHSMYVTLSTTVSSDHVSLSCTEPTCHSLSHTYTQTSPNFIFHHKVASQHHSMTSPVIQCVTLPPNCVTLSLTVSPRHSPGGPQSPSASEGAWSSPQGRHCSAASGRGPQPPADLDGTERAGAHCMVPGMNTCMLIYRDTHSYHT